MKKIIIILLFFVCLSGVFAEEKEISLKPYEDIVKTNYVPTFSLRDLPLQYATSLNPAVLADGKLMVQFPQATVSFFHISSLMQNTKASEALSRFTKFDFSNAKGDLLTIVSTILDSVGKGHSYILSADAGFGIAFKKFGLSVDSQFMLHTMPKIINDETGELSTGSASLTNLGIVPELNAQAMFAYADRLYESDNGDFYVNLGVSTGLKLRLFSKQINASDVLDDNFSLDTLPLFGGWTIPINLSATVGLLNGNLELSVAADNINIDTHFGSYGLNSVVGLNNAAKALFKSNPDGVKWDTPFQLNFFGVLNPHFKTLNPVISFDFIDIIGYFKNDVGKGKNFVELLKHLNLQANVRILDSAKILDAKVAYKFGYPEFGLSVGAFGTKVEVAYGWKDSSNIHGEKPVDYFNILVNLGFDKN